ncbi:transcriptional regulator, ArsR family [Caenispirillum salinarum AK4]|uniref:Transcriptional regulator, ArsR family n=1 Tax=Caenispirillum salinarum AK4 TaxID=1238182 RepID=K9H3S7_9PROT|nr:metalloregulator ArsR/SmtB family transcription factor [Caenispirillum salinarum]EKV32930.1 transcriptional regulator, ArsR family [Caenispirillum salinarum AK4]
MNSDDAVLALSALAYGARMDIFRLLIRAGTDGLPAGRIAEGCGLSASTLSFHLNQLKAAGLVTNRRAGRSLIYSANSELVDALIAYLGDTLRPAASASEDTATPDEDVINVLFVGAGNSGRSIMAESVLNHLGRGRFRAFSAGVRHTGKVSGMALDILRRAGFPADAARSKPLEMFTAPDAAAVLNIVITVSEDAGGLNTGALPGQPVHGHWPTADPLGVVGTEVEIAAVYDSVLASLVDRISTLTALPLRSLDPVTLQRRLAAIGRHAGDDVSSPARGVA